MCARELSLPWRAHAGTVNQFRVLDVIITGAAVGLVCTAAFGIVHSLAIVPIWTRLARGLVPAILAGIALAWAFEQLAQARGWRTSVHGAAFGLVMFVPVPSRDGFSLAIEKLPASSPPRRSY